MISQKHLGFLLSGLLIIFLIALPVFILPSMAKNQALSLLQENTPFTDIKIEKADIGLSSFTLTHIQFDKDRSVYIDKLYADIFWPSFIFSGKIDALKIDRLQINQKLISLTDLKTTLMSVNARSLYNIPVKKYSVKSAEVNLDTPYGILRIDTRLSIQEDDQGTKTVEARSQASQYQLSFDTRWNGIISKENGLEISGEVVTGRFNFGAARLSRIYGWLNYAQRKEGFPDISGELLAGSGNILSIPFQDISMIIGTEHNDIDFLLRASGQGRDDVHLTSDLKVTPEQTLFSSSLNIADLPQFLHLIHNQREIQKAVPDAIESLKDVQAKVDYLHERRFAGGPLPFSLTITSEEEKDLMNGHFLIYPDSLDVRGTAQTKKGLAKALQEYLSIPDEKVSNQSIRLDGNIQTLLEPTPN